MRSATALVARTLPRPADGLLHPIVLGAVIVLIANDQLLKDAWPGVITGKLSDVAGLLLAPIALQATWEVAAWRAGRWRGPSNVVLAVAIGGVGLAFAAIQVWPPATDLYRWGLGAAQWPFRALIAFLAGAPGVGLVPVQMTADAGDLLALPALAITWWTGRRRGPPGR